VTELSPWPQDQPRRASVNSFGYGGANGHVVLDHESMLAERRSITSEQIGTAPKRLYILPFSAHTPVSLSANISATAHTIRSATLADVAYTLSARRTKFSHKTFLVVDSTTPTEALDQANRLIVNSSSSQSCGLAFIFTGRLGDP
jgi:acyl transferase domain-containing protein